MSTIALSSLPAHTAASAPAETLARRFQYMDCTWRANLVNSDRPFLKQVAAVVDFALGQFRNLFVLANNGAALVGNIAYSVVQGILNMGQNLLGLRCVTPMPAQIEVTVPELHRVEVTAELPVTLTSHPEEREAVIEQPTLVVHKHQTTTVEVSAEEGVAPEITERASILQHVDDVEEPTVEAEVSERVSFLQQADDLEGLPVEEAPFPWARAALVTGGIALAALGLWKVCGTKALEWYRGPATSFALPVTRIVAPAVQVK